MYVYYIMKTQFMSKADYAKFKKRALKKYAGTTYKKTRKAGKSKKGTNKRKARGGRLQGKARHAGTSHLISFGVATKHMKKPFLAKVEKLLAPQFELVDYAKDITSTAQGAQGVALLGYSYGPYDIRTFNGSASAGVPVTAGYGRVLLDQCTQKFFITNNSNANIFVDVYDCVFRRDLPTTKDPLGLWDDGLTLQGGGAVAVKTRLGATPFHSTFFTSYVKVLKVTRLNMAHSESAEHIKTTKANRLWNHIIDNNAASGLNQGGLKGLTNFTMAVYWAAPYNENNLEGVAANTTTPVINFNCVESKTYRFHNIETSATAVGYQNNLPTGKVLVVSDITMTEQLPQES